VLIIFHYLVKLMQHYDICFSVMKIYAKFQAYTISCRLAKIEHSLWCCITSTNVK